ncbi:MAG: hypothetical protein ACI837_000067 [Crocinitomicaceae bacterium]|jgi:hypothetical protein
MKKNLSLFPFLCALLVSSFGFSQQTVGLLEWNAGVTDGYTLFTPENNSSVYLIDNCGEKVNEWTFTERPGLTCYLLENGNLLRSGKDSLEIRDWDNTLIWSYAMTANGLLQHHDIEPLPNGNILCILTDLYTQTESLAAGRNPALGSGNFKLDRLVEIQPTGTNGAIIVWEWKFFDHLVQDFDNTKANFGTVADSSQLLDVNYNNLQLVDYTHANGIDYNAELDQIIISCKNTNELYIIDHSTTSLLATGHTGGNSNRGGDFLWRWGNPQVYQQGTGADQTLFDQHDPKWVPSAFADSGKISVFNNNGDGSATFSSIHLIIPEFVGNAYSMDPNKFLPLTYDWSWNGSILGAVVFSNKKCGMQVLPSGNVLFCETPTGMISEITKAGEHVWSYRNPAGSGSVIYDQYDIITTADNGIFRGERYPSNYPGLAGEDLTPQGIIENQNVLSQSCILGTPEMDESSGIFVVNPVTEDRLVFNQWVTLDHLEIRDIMGKLVFSKDSFNGSECTVKLEKGTYFLRVNFEGKILQQKLVAY